MMVGVKAKDNPFTTGRVRRALPYDPTWVGTDWPQLLAELEVKGRRVGIIGPHGSGKTTFLDTLADRLRQQGRGVHMVFLNRENRQIDHSLWEAIQEVGINGETLLMDGYEQLSWRSRLRLEQMTRSAGALIVTAHRRTRYPTLLQTGTEAVMFQQFVRRLAPSAPWSAEELEAIFKQCRGNVREALWVCYDRYAAG
jgi:ABC-type dipeptide/oligopeptide/nickel transport system ATPase component